MERARRCNAPCNKWLPARPKHIHNQLIRFNGPKNSGIPQFRTEYVPQQVASSWAAIGSRPVVPLPAAWGPQVPWHPLPAASRHPASGCFCCWAESRRPDPSLRTDGSCTLHPAWLTLNPLIDQSLTRAVMDLFDLVRLIRTKSNDGYGLLLKRLGASAGWPVILKD